MVNLRTTLQHIAADYKRRVLLTGKQHSLSRFLELFKPGMTCVICYRLSRYFAYSKLKFLFPIFLVIESLITRNQISPYAVIGPGLFVSDLGNVGITNEVKIGKNCTLLGFNTFAVFGTEDFDAEDEEHKITLGDHCVLGVRAKVMKIISIADGCQIKNGSVVMFSVPKVGTTLMGNIARRKGTSDYGDIVRWNPWLGGYLY